MILRVKLLVLLFTILLVHRSYGEAFTRSPGIVKTDPGGNAVMTWTLSKSFDTTEFYASVSIFKTDIDKSVITYRNPDKPCDTNGNNRLDCVLPKPTGRIVGFSITGVRDTDAGQYSIEVIHDINSQRIKDNNGFVYIYKSPVVQVSGRHEAIEGNSIALTCRATSQSLPVSLRYTAKMVYNWNINNPEGNHVVNGNQVTIQTTNKHNQGATFMCVVKEDGSSLTGSDKVALNILYAPNVVSLNTSDLTVTEGGKVAVQCRSDCNPSCRFTWRRESDTTWSDNSNLLILSDISRHYNDLFTCQAENNYGTKTKSFKITVNFAPEIISFVPSTSGDIIQYSTLNITCEVSSRPKSTITITNNNTSDIILSVSDTHKAVYTFDRVHMLDSGVYQCSATNGIKPMADVPRAVTLDVKGGYNFCESPTAEESIIVMAKLTISFCLIANPFVQITDNNWTFTSSERDSMIHGLPDGVLTSIQDANQPYKKYVILIIPTVKESHFGTYTLKVKNSYNSKCVTHVFRLLKLEISKNMPVPLIVGVISAVLILILLVGTIVALWRRGIFHSRNVNENISIPKEMFNQSETNREEQFYEHVEMSSTQQQQISSVYQSLAGPTLTTFPESDIVLQSLLTSGDFYNTWNGQLKSKEHLPIDVILKSVKDKGSSSIHKQYLKEQGAVLCKLRSDDYTIACFGISKENNILVMECAPMGHLQAYLKEQDDISYYNIRKDHHLPKHMNFIPQIIRGVKSVHKLQPPALFYCLSASNVLIINQQQCKLTGFATSTAVTEREKFEEDYKLPRPIKWLAPEAIKLNHIRESDIWSLGVLMWEIGNQGKSPLSDKSDEEARFMIGDGQKLLKPRNCSNEMYDIMCSCWMYQPHKRPSLDDVESQLLEITQYEIV